MPIRTIDINALVAKTGNLFETVAILSKRSRQVASKMKAELDDKLAYFESFDLESEDTSFQEEQKRISVAHESLAQPTEVAIGEMFDGEIYYRDPASEVE